MKKHVHINTKVGFHKMLIDAEFPTGARFKYLMRSREDLIKLAFSNDYEELKEQCKIFTTWMKYRWYEFFNIQRLMRLQRLCLMCRSGREMIERMK